MHRTLVVTERAEFRGCTMGQEGLRMRVSGSMSIRELQDRFGHFAACVNGQRVLLSRDSCVSDVVSFDEDLWIFVYPGAS